MTRNKQSHGTFQTGGSVMICYQFRQGLTTSIPLVQHGSTWCFVWPGIGTFARLLETKPWEVPELSLFGSLLVSLVSLDHSIMMYNEGQVWRDVHLKKVKRSQVLPGEQRVWSCSSFQSCAMLCPWAQVCQVPRCYCARLTLVIFLDCYIW